MAVRESDGKVVGFIVFRHKLEYDDDAGKIMDKQLLLDEDNDNRGSGY